MAGDINRVTIVGRLTRDPELAHLPSGTAVLQVGSRGQRSAEGRRRQLDRQAELLRRQSVWQPGRRSEQPPGQRAPRRRGRSPRLVLVGSAGRHASARRWRSSPSPCSSSTVAETLGAAAVTASASSSRPQQPPATRTSRPPLRQTTTFRSDAAARRRREARQGPAAGPQAPGPVVRPDPPEVVLLLQGQGRRDRLQEREPATPVHLGTGQDPLAAYQRRLPAASAASGSRRQART